MRASILLVAAITWLPATSFADYMRDWNSRNFFESVNTCRVLVMDRTISSYERKGLANGWSEEVLRNELVSMTKVFETVATDVCYCALNELAKEKLNEEFNNDTSSIRAYFDKPVCKISMAESLTLFNSKEKIHGLRLK